MEDKEKIKTDPKYYKDESGNYWPKGSIDDFEIYEDIYCNFKKQYTICSECKDCY